MCLQMEQTNKPLGITRFIARHVIWESCFHHDDDGFNSSSLYIHIPYSQLGLMFLPSPFHFVQCYRWKKTKRWCRLRYHLLLYILYFTVFSIPVHSLLFALDLTWILHVFNFQSYLRVSVFLGASVHLCLHCYHRYSEKSI